MSNEFMSQKNKIKSALERIADLEAFVEGDLQKVVGAIDQALQTQQVQTRQLATVIQALVEILGAETVDAKIKELEAAKQAKALEDAKAALEDALLKGLVAKAEAVSEQSLLVGFETDAEGQVLAPGRAQISYASLNPTYKEKFLGLTAGEKVTLDNGNTFNLTEIYGALPQPEVSEAEVVTEQAEG